MLMPVLQDVRAKAGLDQQEIGFTCSGSTDYLSGPGLQLRVDPRRRRPLAAHPGEPRRDGRRLGAVRGLGEAPARRDRHRARLLLRQVVAGPAPRGAVPPARPVQRRPAVARRHQPRRAPGPGAARRGQGHRGRLRRGRGPQPAQRPRQPERPAGVGPLRRRTSSRRSRSWTRCASTTARRSPTAPARSSSPPTTRPAALRERPAWIRGIDHRIEPMALGVRDLTTSASTRHGGREGRRRRRPVDVAELHAPFSPPGADPARGARPRRTTTT